MKGISEETSQMKGRTLWNERKTKLILQLCVVLQVAQFKQANV